MQHAKRNQIMQDRWVCWKCTGQNEDQRSKGGTLQTKLIFSFCYYGNTVCYSICQYDDLESIFSFCSDQNENTNLLNDIDIEM